MQKYGIPLNDTPLLDNWQLEPVTAKPNGFPYPIVVGAGGAGAAWRRGGAAATATARTDAGDQRRRKQQASPAGPGGKGHGHSNRITSRYGHYVTEWPGILVRHNPA